MAPMVPDTDDLELVRHLMAKATALLENAAGQAALGQSTGLSLAVYAEIARRAGSTTRQAATLLEAAAALVASNGRESVS